MDNFLKIVIFGGNFNNHQKKHFSNRNKNFKHYKLYNINSKHPVITILKHFLFCLFFLLLLYKANNIKTNFEVLKYWDSKEIFSKDSYLTMQAIRKTETKKILSYYALSKIHLRKHKSYFRFILLLSDIRYYTDILPFSNSIFSINYYRISLASNDENRDIEKWKSFKKKGLYFVHINISSLLPKIDELWHLAKTTDASVVGTRETKLHNSTSSSEIEIEGYDLLKVDGS